MQPITLYDIPGNASSQKAWSPNVWKARYALNIKGLPHTTVWIEYPDIEAEMRRIGAMSTSARDGKPLYTLPAILDPNTGTALADSRAIALYLEKTYPTPDTPALFPPGTRALQLGFHDAFDQRVRQAALLRLMLLPNTLQMNAPSAKFFRRTREAMFGENLESLAPPGEKTATLIRGVLEGLRVLGSWMDSTAEEGPFIGGNQPVFADLEVASYLLWTRIVGGMGEGTPWNAVVKVDGGRWERYAKEFEKWETVH